MRITLLLFIAISLLAGIAAAAEEKKDDKKPAAPEKINLQKPADYKFEKWQYRFDITSPGTRSEGRWGWLMYDGQRLPPAEVNDYYETPWGTLYWVGGKTEKWGDHGWLPVAVGSAPKGRQLPDPAATAPSVALTKADNEKTVSLVVGQILGVRLEGNPTTGYRWVEQSGAGKELVRVGDPQFIRPADTEGRVGAGGHFLFKYMGIAAGKITLTFNYARPWERDKPAERFTVTVDVVPATKPEKPASTPGK